jgi:hypothetical protein
MGRKRIIHSAKKTQVSLSLSNSDVERIDLMTNARSRWIRKAIHDKFNANEGLMTIDSKQMLFLLHARHSDNIDIQELIERILKKLPDSGE